MAWIDALELLDADDGWILERCGPWYIADRDPRWLRRNALVALGNCAEPGDEHARDVLDRYGAGPDAVLAEHARWARRRLDERAVEQSAAEARSAVGGPAS
jgi:epoxyqueuosine reductase